MAGYCLFDSVHTDKTVYSVVTVGCPTAYSFKFKAGGLAKLQNTSALVGLGAGDTKSARAKNVSSEFFFYNLELGWSEI